MFCHAIIHGLVGELPVGWLKAERGFFDLASKNENLSFFSSKGDYPRTPLRLDARSEVAMLKPDVDWFIFCISAS